MRGGGREGHVQQPCPRRAHCPCPPTSRPPLPAAPVAEVGVPLAQSPCLIMSRWPWSSAAGPCAAVLWPSGEVVSKVDMMGSAHHFPSWLLQQLHQRWAQHPELMVPWLSLATPGHCPTTALLPFWFSQPVEVESPPEQCTSAGAGGSPTSPHSASPVHGLTLPGAGGPQDHHSAMRLGTSPVPAVFPSWGWTEFPSSYCRSPPPRGHSASPPTL